jgi:hypothetical protein
MQNFETDPERAGYNDRHERGEESVMPPPLELAVKLVSSGATHIRWLAELDAKLKAGPRD